MGRAVLRLRVSHDHNAAGLQGFRAGTVPSQVHEPRVFAIASGYGRAGRCSDHFSRAMVSLAPGIRGCAYLEHHLKIDPCWCAIWCNASKPPLQAKITLPGSVRRQNCPQQRCLPELLASYVHRKDAEKPGQRQRSSFRRHRGSRTRHIALGLRGGFLFYARLDLAARALPGGQPPELLCGAHHPRHLPKPLPYKMCQCKNKIVLTEWISRATQRFQSIRG